MYMFLSNCHGLAGNMPCAALLSRSSVPDAQFSADYYIMQMAFNFIL